MKKLLALLLAMMMVFTLAACDTGDDPNPSGSEGDKPGTSQTDNQGGESTNGDNQDGEENKDDKFTQLGLSIDGVLPEGYSELSTETDDDGAIDTLEFKLPSEVSHKTLTAFMDSYFAEVFALTASVSDDGNYKDGNTAWNEIDLVPISELSEVGSYTVSYKAEWYYKYNGKTCHISVFCGQGGRVRVTEIKN